MGSALPIQQQQKISFLPKVSNNRGNNGNKQARQRGKATQRKQSDSTSGMLLCCSVALLLMILKKKNLKKRVVKGYIGREGQRQQQAPGQGGFSIGLVDIQPRPGVRHRRTADARRDAGFGMEVLRWALPLR